MLALNHIEQSYGLLAWQEPIVGKNEFQLILCRNPFSIEQERFCFPVGITVLDVIKSLKINNKNLRIYINDYLILEKQYAIIKPQSQDLVTVRCAPCGGDGEKNPLRTIASLAVAIAAAYVGNYYHAGYGLALAFAGNYAINQFLPLPKAQVSNFSGIGGTSTSYAISGSRNQLLPFGVVPRVLGQARMWPPFATKPYTEVNGNNVYVRMLYCLGPGPLNKSQTKIGETSTDNFSDIEIEYLTGNEVSTLYPSDIYQNSISTLLPGTEVLYTDDPPQDWTIRTTQTGVTTFSVDIFAPLLQYYIDSPGIAGIYPISVICQFYVKDHTTQVDGTIVSIERENLTSNIFTNDPDSKYFTVAGIGGEAVRGSFRVTMSTSGQWDIGIRKYHEYFYFNGTIIHPEGFYYGPTYDDVYWDILRSETPVSAAVNVRNEDIEFIALRIRASEQLNGIVDTFNLVCQAHHPVYSGSWAIQATSNPAWIYASVLTDSANKRAVAYSRLDAAGLLTWATNCTTNGFTFGAVITDKTTVFELLRQIATIGKASFAIIDGKYGIVEDKTKTTPVQLFTPRNSWGASGNKVYDIIPHALRCKYKDAINGYADAERIVYDDGYDSETATEYKEIDFLGVSDEDHAWKLGRYWLAAKRLRPEIYTRNVDIEHLVCTRGDLVLLRDDVMLVGLGQARIKTIAIDGSDITITFDDLVTMEAGKDYGIEIRTNTVFISVQVVTSVGTTDTLDFSLAPASSALLAVGNLFAFGEYGSETIDAIVHEIIPGPDLTATMLFLDYAPGVQTASTGSIPEYDPGITIPPDITQQPPTGPVIDSIVSDDTVIIYAEDGTETNCILVSFHVPILGDYITPVGIDCQYKKILTPYLSGGVWSDDTPSAGYVTWNEHTIYYCGDYYTIATGNTTDQYIYWVPGDSVYSTSATELTTPIGILISQNSGGTNTLETMDEAGNPWLRATDINYDGGRARIIGVDKGWTYRIRIRSISQYDVKSPWVYSYHVTSGILFAPPDISDLETTAGSSDSFVGRDVDVVWSYAESQSKAPKFEIIITHGAGDLRVEYTSEAHFRYTYAMNVEDGSGTPSNVVVIKIRAFNAAGYSSTVTGTFTNAAPANIADGNVYSSPWMNGLEFWWDESSETDIDYYLYRWQIESEGWSSWYKSSKAQRVYVFLDDTQTETYPNGADVYFEVKAVDTFGSEGGAGAESNTTGSLYIPYTALTDFEQISGAFYEVPVLRGFTWQSDTPSPGDVAWSSGTVYYNGTAYAVGSGSSSGHWIYWNPNGTTTVFVSTDSDSTIPEGAIIIAINNSGTYALAWNNAVANQVIGSAWIRDAAIVNAKIANLAVTNAKINDLDAIKINAGYLSADRIQAGSLNANKITTGTLTATQISGTGFGNLTITSGTVTIQTTNGLTISGSGNVLVSGGNDIDLIGDNSDPGKVNFVGTSYTTTIGSNTTGSQLSIEPLANNTCTLNIGGGHVYSSNKFNTVEIIANTTAKMRALVTSTSDEASITFAASGLIQLYSKNLATGRYLTFQQNSSPGDGEFYPTPDNTCRSGRSGNRWIEIWAVNGTIQTSDARDKECIRPIEFGLDFLMKLRPVGFNFIGSKEVKQGLIAQDVEEILDGRSLGALYYGSEADRYGMNYADFVPLLIKWMQDQQKQIDELKDK